MEFCSKTLFSLLRLAIGTSSESEELSALTKADWNAVVDMAFDQSVAAISVDGLQRSLELRGESLERDLLESEELEDLRYELFGEALACEEDYRNYEEAISSLAETYSEAGIEMMVLKGYGLSLNYPVPEHRPTGDIDVYLSDWKRGDEIISQRGIAIDYSHSLDRDSELEKRVLEDIMHPSFSEKGSGFLFKLRRLKANMWKRNLVATEAFLPRMARLAWSHVISPENKLTK